MPEDIGIPCAADRDVDEMAHTLPNMASAVQGWFRPLMLIFVNASVVEGKVKTGKKKFQCQGMIQPFTAQQLKLKAEGERAWKWKLLYTTPEVNLDAGDDFTIKGTPYRVMRKCDWSEYGINAYELVEDFDEQSDQQP
jgi:hypothetical protein